MASLLQSDTQLNQQSYYEASVERPALLAPLQTDIAADVVVVGAGYAGLSAALELTTRGFKVVVLEADRICSGASGRNGGQTIVGYASGQGPFEEQLGRDLARQVWDMSLEAIDLVDQRIAAFDIDCDRVHGYMYVADSPRKARELEADVRSLERDYGFASTWAEGADIQKYIGSERYQACAYETRSGHLHPLKYGLGLARAAQALGVQILNSRRWWPWSVE